LNPAGGLNRSCRFRAALGTAIYVAGFCKHDVLSDGSSKHCSFANPDWYGSNARARRI